MMRIDNLSKHLADILDVTLHINSTTPLSLYPSLSHTHTHTLSPPLSVSFSCISIRYLALRILELVISIDYASLQLLVIDLGADFTFVSRKEQMAVNAPQQWAEEFSSSSVSPERRLQVIMLIEGIVITERPRPICEPWFSQLQS